jgi:hypothetical protein
MYKILKAEKKQYIWDSINSAMFMNENGDGWKRSPASINGLEKFVPNLKLVSTQKKRPKELDDIKTEAEMKGFA